MLYLCQLWRVWPFWHPFVNIYVFDFQFNFQPFLCNFSYFLWLTYFPADKYIGSQDVPRTSPSNVSRPSPKDSIWPSQGHPDLTSWGGPEMTSRDVLIWRSRDVPGGWFGTCPRGDQDVPYRKFRVTKLRCPKKILNFSFRSYSIEWICLTLKVYWEPSETSKMKFTRVQLRVTVYYYYVTHASEAIVRRCSVKKTFLEFS